MACQDRECSVCYSESGPFRKLTCSHEFCTGCIKTWYLKGSGTGCPMCRRPIYFKGFHNVRDEWDEVAWENRCADVFSAAIDQRVEEYLEDIEQDCEAIEDEEEDAAWLAAELLELDNPVKVCIQFMRSVYGMSPVKVAAKYREFRLKGMKRELVLLERTYRFLKSEDVSSEDVEEVLMYSDDYYSDRNVGRWAWADEPTKELATRYPKFEKTAKAGKRCRALEDEWATLNFVIIL